GQEDLAAGEARQKLGADKILGVSVSNVEEALTAEKQGADYLGVGAVFATNSKKDAGLVSLSTLRAICRAVALPVVAIGGLNQGNLSQLNGCGLAGVSLMSAIWSAPDIVQTTRHLKILASQITQTPPLRTALSIAGSDCSGGAGIQADLKTMLANGVYGMTAITALTAQNTLGVQEILEVTPPFLDQQLDSIFQDIFPNAVKIGMVSSSPLIEVIAQKLSFYQASNIVVEPDMVTTRGARLISPFGIQTLQKQLFPLAALITPNLPEAEILAEMKIQTLADREKAAKKIGSAYHCSVLCKGGHSDAKDLLYHNDQLIWYQGAKIANLNTHGTGCTLSSAIAAHLAQGSDLPTAIQKAKAYVAGAIRAGLNLGQGRGPLNHGFALSDQW
ncbi:MAG: bifunctional hydroxymethylpyrimidine kinase/phosphomethylpyrimidine kinase, partial [Clostridia bacterium]|nr:bifunctional hydroxymethylpyrimidine kinase/phosphomethylpyrimidine kinase [Clostridia bacterium]